MSLNCDGSTVQYSRIAGISIFFKSAGSGDPLISRMIRVLKSQNYSWVIELMETSRIIKIIITWTTNSTLEADFILICFKISHTWRVIFL